MRALIDSVKQLDFSNKDITNQINQVNNRYDELVADANGEKHLTRIKKALIKLKNYIKDTSLNEGVVQNTLFSCSQMRSGKHHLYDDALMNNGGESSPRVRSTY